MPEYESARSADNEKLYFNASKNDIFNVEIFSSEIEVKNIDLKLKNRMV